MSLFDIGEVAITCPSCGSELSDEDDLRPIIDAHPTCSDCYVNADCPSQCNADHEGPDAPWSHRGGNEYECPETGNYYYWLGGNYLHSGGEWVDYETALVGSVWYDIDDTYWCSSCENRVHCDDWDGYADECDDCVSQRERHEAEYEDGDSGEAVGPSTWAICQQGNCRHSATHWNPISERVYCQSHGGMSARCEELPELVAA